MATYTKSEIRGAILRAADSIQDNNELWAYGNCYVGACGTPMCAAGWIGHHLAIPANTSINAACDIMRLGAEGPFPYDIFEKRMCDLDARWSWTPDSAVATLRAYADKYFPAEQLEPAYIKFRASLTNELVS